MAVSVMLVVTFMFVFVFEQKTAYEMRISDWSSDVCSSDLPKCRSVLHHIVHAGRLSFRPAGQRHRGQRRRGARQLHQWRDPGARQGGGRELCQPEWAEADRRRPLHRNRAVGRSEEHTSELQSLMRISYAVFCLKKKKEKQQT